MGIVLVGTSHKTAPVEVRERLAFAESRLAGALRELVDLEMISEGLIVSTCNRVELIAATRNDAHAAENAVSRLYDFLGHFHQYDLSPLRNHLYDLAGRAAIKHVFRVTSSLDSMVVGEPQITGQIKEAFLRA
jgi:glutamyl-tRNA reductase